MAIHDGTSNIFAVTDTGVLTQLRTIYMIPEYENALTRPNGTSNRGTLTTGYDSTNRRSYYSWTTNEPTVQNYEIIVRVKLPDGFSGFAADAPVKLYTKSSDPGDSSTKVVVEMKDSDGGTVNLNGSASVALNGAATTGYWDEAEITVGTPNTEFDAGQWVTFIITLYANQNDTIYVGELSLKGNW